VADTASNTYPLRFPNRIKGARSRGSSPVNGLIHPPYDRIAVLSLTRWLNFVSQMLIEYSRAVSNSAPTIQCVGLTNGSAPMDLNRSCSCAAPEISSQNRLITSRKGELAPQTLFGLIHQKLRRVLARLYLILCTARRSHLPPTPLFKVLIVTRSEVKRMRIVPSSFLSSA
jgi:hypothetical protein